MTMKTAMMALAAIAAVICNGQGLATVQGGPTNLVATGRDVGDAGLCSYPTPKTAGELKLLIRKIRYSPYKRNLDALKAAVDNTLECADYSKFKEKYGENADFKKADPDAIKFAEHIKKHKLKYIERIVEELEAEREEVIKKEEARGELIAAKCAEMRKKFGCRPLTLEEQFKFNQEWKAEERKFNQEWKAEARRRREARRKNRLLEKTNSSMLQLDSLYM